MMRNSIVILLLLWVLSVVMLDLLIQDSFKEYDLSLYLGILFAINLGLLTTLYFLSHLAITIAQRFSSESLNEVVHTVESDKTTYEDSNSTVSTNFLREISAIGKCEIETKGSLISKIRSFGPVFLERNEFASMLRTKSIKEGTEIINEELLTFISGLGEINLPYHVVSSEEFGFSVYGFLTEPSSKTIKEIKKNTVRLG